MRRRGDWFLNVVEWFFMPLTWHERQRLDPKTEAFKAKMRAIEESRGKCCEPAPAPEAAVEKRPDPERGGIPLEVLRGLLVLVVVFNTLATAGSGCVHATSSPVAVERHAPAGYTAEQARLWRKCVEAGGS